MRESQTAAFKSPSWLGEGTLLRNPDLINLPPSFFPLNPIVPPTPFLAPFIPVEKPNLPFFPMVGHEFSSGGKKKY